MEKNRALLIAIAVAVAGLVAYSSFGPDAEVETRRVVDRRGATFVERTTAAAVVRQTPSAAERTVAASTAPSLAARIAPEPPAVAAGPQPVAAAAPIPASCFAKANHCGDTWASLIAKPRPNERVLTFQKNDCGFAKPDLGRFTRELIQGHVLHFHGDSTLRQTLKVLIKFIGINGNLEKRDANKTGRAPKFFDEAPPNSVGGDVRIMFRFDYVPEHLNEPIAPYPKRFRGAPRVDLVSLGVHAGDEDIVERKFSLDAAVARIPGLMDGNLTRYLRAVNADPKVRAVVFLLQDLECDQMPKAAVKSFQERAKYCGKIEQYLEVFNARLKERLDADKALARKVVVMNPMRCVKLRPHGEACTRDGIHMGSRYVRTRLEAVLDLLDEVAVRCPSGHS